MKKFLSMVLALVMAMSLVTISSSAAFTDAADIDYKEAVDVMTAVGIVDGYTDGSFGPDGYLSRGAAAKIICNMILGPTTASALVADAAPYSDVPADSTFAGYIAYCQKEGIISGYADGTFKPGNSLTGYAFMKMLLGALGYDVEIEGYTGNNWSINVAKQAIALGLNNGLATDFVGVNTVTRQEALLYAFNAMNTTMVQYPNNTQIVVGDIKVSTTAAATVMPNTSGVDYAGKTDKTTMEFAEKYFAKLTSAPAEDMYGRPATKWTWKNKAVGTYAEKADATYYYAATLHQIRQDLGIANTYKPTFEITFNGASCYDGVNTKILPAATSNDGVYNYSWMTGNDDGVLPYEYTAPGRGITVEYYYDAVKSTAATPDYSDNKVVMIDQMIGKITAVKTDDTGRYVTVQGTSLRYYTEDFNKGDYVIYTIAYNNGTNKIGSMQAAEMITGTVTWLTDTNNDGKFFYTMIDGVGYYNHAYSYLALNIGDVVNCWLDANGYIIKTEVTEAATALDKLVLISAKEGGSFGSTNAKVIYGDGKGEVVSLYQGLGAQDVVYNYTTVSGKLKVLDTVGYTSAPAADATLAFDKGDTTIGGDIKVNAATGFVYIDPNGVVKTYAGYKNAPSIKAGGANKIVALTKDTTGIATVVYVWTNANGTFNKSNEITWLVTDFAYQYTTTNSANQPYSYYSVKTLDGMTLKVTQAVYDYLYSQYYVGAIAADDLVYDENGCVASFSNVGTLQKQFAGANNAYGYYFNVKTTQDVLYIAEETAYYGTDLALAYADDVQVIVVAYNGDTYYEEDIATLDGIYTGFAYTVDAYGLVDTVVLKEINPDA